MLEIKMVGCSYKEFLACNPKEYDGKGGVVVLTQWIEKMESVQDMSSFHEMQRLETKFWNHAMVGVPCCYTDSNRAKTMQKAVQISGALTDEVVRNGSIKKVEKREIWGNLAREKNGGMK
ncbi:hypothetical protein Tco_0663095 [Tanacetum coccineum]